MSSVPTARFCQCLKAVFNGWTRISIDIFLRKTGPLIRVHKPPPDQDSEHLLPYFPTGQNRFSPLKSLRGYPEISEWRARSCALSKDWFLTPTCGTVMYGIME